MGIILATIAVRFLTRTSLEEERKALEAAEENDPASAPKHLVIRVTKTAAEGRTLEALHQFLNVQFVISRCILPDGTLLIPGRETVLEQNMQVHLVCAERTPNASANSSVSSSKWDTRRKSRANSTSAAALS